MDKRTAKSTAEIRRAFLDYFQARGHTVVPSSPLVPIHDPTLLFTNAGMVQFKEVFVGREQRPYKRAASCQACVRVGGKHNDLENVGYTARHHTFFEMLGNFSFGDYFKREAIRYAWEFLTEILEIPKERLWVTVFHEDHETETLWLEEIGIDPARFSRCGEESNFWTMGATGPCGPSTEVFYDHGPAIAGGPPGSPEQHGDRYVEIWNLVFTQYDRDDEGRLHRIPKPSVDTGMGLERIAAVMQGVHSNYAIDLFQVLTAAICTMLGRAPEARDKASLDVIADHIRSCAFIAAEGVVPSNEGRGYVLRRIIRRAIRHGHTLGIEGPFFYRLVEALGQAMGSAYSQFLEAKSTVAEVLRQEEERFAETLEQGLRLLDRSLAELSGTVIPGKDIFQLYDTYGFPVELTADIARERGLTLDMEGFEREMTAQRERARAASQFNSGGYIPVLQPSLSLPGNFEFTGYEGVTAEGHVTGLFIDGEPTEIIKAGEQGIVVLDRSPFYAEGGGQIGDTGDLRGPEGVFHVRDTQKQGGVHVHLGALKIGQLKRGDRIQAQVDAALRQATALNHSATHLLHAALRKILGKHVQQKGSLVAPDRLRFDFSHTGSLTAEQWREVERLVNREIRANREVEIRVMPVQKALESGAMALFGEKYEDEVRVLTMGDLSVELCGGTHVRRTGDIGLFKIIAETGIAAGIRRIEALTGEAALAWIEETEQRLGQIAELIKGARDTVTEKTRQLLHQLRQQEKLNQTLKAKLSSRQGTEPLTAQVIDVAGIKVLATVLEGADAATLRMMADQLKSTLGTAAFVLASVDNSTILLVAGVTKDITRTIRAGDLVNFVARQVGGKGGGRPDLAQGGGNDPSKLSAALQSVPGWVREQIEPSKV
jgi:alanyl-tRNA synthetase